MNIAKYVASIGFSVNTQDIKKVDRALNLVENKMRNLQKRLNSKPLSIKFEKFTVNQARLNATLGNALDAASPRVAFEISRFVVNDRNLLAALLRAARRLPPAPPPGPHPPPGPGGGGPHPGSSTRTSRFGLGFGGFGYGSLGLFGGAYGLGALNRRNQEVVSAQLQSQAVVQQAGGTAEQGQASFQYLRSEANRIGFNYLDAAPDYNKLISGLTSSGVSVRESQKVFSGFAELARVQKLDKTTQNRLFRALSQVAGKGKLQAEELTGQISEALAGGTALFAQAYQKQIGGNLTGQQAIAKLQADMKKGLVRSDILTFAGAAASERANIGGGLVLAGQASQAEQQRYQNAVSDLAVVASNAGVEEGFARIFRTLNAGLSESDGLVKGLAEGFNEATKFADDLLLFPQSFIRALEGRDSVVADWLGADATKQLQEDWKSIRSSLDSISTIGAPSWLPTLQTTSQDIAAQFRIIAQIASGDFTGLGDALTNFVSGRYQTYGNALASGPNLALRAVGNTFDFSVPQISFGDGSDSFVPKSVTDLYGLGNNPAAGDSTRFGLFSKDLLGPKESNAFGQQPAALDYGLSGNQFDRSFIGADARSVTTTNQFSIQLNVDAATLGGIDIEVQARQLAQAFATNLEQVAVFFPQKE